MEWTRLRPWLGTAARLVLGVVWIWSAVPKLRDPLLFTQTVRAYDATPEWLSKAIGYGLPVLELALGVVLILGITVRIAAAVSAAVLLVVLIGLVQAAARGIHLAPGFFGVGGTTDTSAGYFWEILGTLVLLGLAGYLVVWSFTHLSIEEYLARHDYVEMPSAKRMRTPEGRRKYEAEVESKRASARSRSLYVDGSVVLIVALVTVIGIGVQAGRAKITNVVPGTHASASNGVVFGKPAAATVDIYEDFGCTSCKQFENSVASKLEHQVRGNVAQVRYHPIALLDRRSPNQYSSRAANAALCVSDVSVDDFVAYRDLLFGASQPAEGTSGPGAAELTALAKKAGVNQGGSTTVSDCILNGKYAPLVKQLTEKASERGITTTPTVYVNGKQVSATSSALFGAIAAANVGHTPSPSKTPTPTPSSSVSPSPSSSAAPSPSPSGSKTKKS